MPTYPSPETSEHATQRQRERAARSFDALRKRAVPVFWGPLQVDDDDNAKPQEASDVARRALVLWAFELRAEGMPQAEAKGLIEHLELWSSVSPAEKTFLQNENPSPDDCRRLTWRLECIWVLMWAFEHIEQLDWPSAMCDVPKLVDLVSPHENDPAFITSAHPVESARAEESMTASLVSWT
ncbi:MAG: DUF4272 domain-containing protein [Planctomycetes bacterium]|nr:DUF4272 domain-containing protein [Planctomycetota bacterium]